MASENETVASVADCIRHMADNMPNGVILNIAQCNFTADRIEVAHRREVAELQRRLKVAEDALESAWMYADKLPHQWPLPERVRTKMNNALATIREEGGAK